MDNEMLEVPDTPELVDQPPAPKDSSEGDMAEEKKEALKQVLEQAQQ